jgi:VWFA-related protein
MLKLIRIMSRVLVLLPFLIGAIAAQNPTFRSETNVVLVPTLVEDHNRKPVYDLQAKDFVIEDDGVPQSVQLDDKAESEPVSLVVAIQCGRRADYEFSRITGLGAMLDAIMSSGVTQVAIVEFDSHVELKRDFTTNSNEIAGELKTLQPGDNGAAILDAIYFSEKLLDKQPVGYNRVLLLISETRDHGSVWAKKLNEVATLAGSSNTSMYALSFSPSRSNVLDTLRGNNRDEMHEGPDLLAPHPVQSSGGGELLMGVQALRRNSPKTIAVMTGGEYRSFATRDRFENDMLDFTNHLHSRYLLSFVPRGPHPGLHSIQVILKSPNRGKVLARSNYWASDRTQ